MGPLSMGPLLMGSHSRRIPLAVDNKQGAKETLCLGNGNSTAAVAAVKQVHKS